MAGRGEGADFVESLARGLDVLQCFSAERPRMSLSEVAAVCGLARPTARRLLLTLEELGFVRLAQGQFSLTPRVLSLGMAFWPRSACGKSAARTWSGSSPAPGSRRRCPSWTARTSSMSRGSRCPS